MRKTTLIALVLVLTATLAACGCRRYDPSETTGDTGTPIVDPTLDMTMPSSNIPDPNTEENSGDRTDPTNDTDPSQPSGETQDTTE